MSTTPTDTPETDAACGTGNWIHCVDADFARTLEIRARAAEARVRELEAFNKEMLDTYLRESGKLQAEIAQARAALRLRPIAEAGPVPEGLIRLYKYLEDQEAVFFIDIYPPKQ